MPRYKLQRSFTVRDIDLHGVYPDEVEYLLSNFLAQCKAERVNAIEIIHGVGDGILRNAVISFLNRHKTDIISYKSGESMGLEGGKGFIRAELKTRQEVKKIFIKSEKTSELQKTEEPFKEYITKLIKLKKAAGKKRYAKRMRRDN
ncbi:MAG: Smr/MutS family protein [Candidatus Margulisbacteria bacterium]|nr:Smr/MutS family protein [Candidatus Margulisiibacteriota bacterium]